MPSSRASGSAVRTPSGRALSLLLVAGAFATVLLNMHSPVFDLERFTAPKELALALTALACALVLMRRPWRIEAGLVGMLLAGFVAWSLVSSLFAANHWLALDGLGVSVSGLAVYLAARRVAEEGSARATLAGLVAAVILGAGLGVAQAYGADWSWLAASRPPGGTFGNRNFLAHLTVIAMPALAFLALRARRGLTALLGVAGLAVAVGAVVLTRSRAAWLGLGAALAVMVLATALGRARALAGIRHARLIVAVVVLAVATAAAIWVPNALSWRSHSPYAETLTGLANYREGSGYGRLIQYRNSLKMLKRDPLLGVGPGNWFVHYPRVTTPGDPSYAGYDPIPTNPWPSSDWIAFLSERGVVGAALLALAGLVAAAAAVRRIGADDPEAAARAVTLLGTLTAAAVTGMFDAVLLLAAPTLYVWAAAGLLLPRTTPAFEWEPGDRTRRALTIAGLTLLSAVVVLGTLRTVAIHTTTDARRATLARAARIDPESYRLQLMLGARGSCRERVPHARAARRLLPYHPAPRALLRECGVNPGR